MQDTKITFLPNIGLHIEVKPPYEINKIKEEMDIWAHIAFQKSQMPRNYQFSEYPNSTILAISGGKQDLINALRDLFSANFITEIKKRELISQVTNAFLPVVKMREATARNTLHAVPFTISKSLKLTDASPPIATPKSPEQKLKLLYLKLELSLHSSSP